MTIHDFIRLHKITASVEWVDSNPHMEDMPDGSTHYRVTLRCGRRSMTVPFSMGPAHTSEPTAAEVLDCLASDVYGREDAAKVDTWPDNNADRPLDAFRFWDEVAP